MQRSMLVGAVAVGLVAFAPGCWSDPQVGPAINNQSNVTGAGLALSAIQTQIFTPSCASALCHGGNTSPSLQGGQSWGNLVNRPASQVPSMLLVSPGNPDQSYLMVTLLGTSGSAAARMPPNGSQLSSDEVDAVRAWISRGAPND